MAGPTFTVEAVQSTSNGMTHTFSLPSGIDESKWIILFVAGRVASGSSSGFSAITSGWTEISSAGHATGANSGTISAVYAKRASASDVQVQVSSDVSVPAIGWIAVVDNCSAVEEVGSNTTGTTVDDVITSSTSLTLTNQTWINFGAWRWTSSGSPIAIDTYSSEFPVSQMSATHSSEFLGMAIQAKDTDGSASVNELTLDTSVNHWNCHDIRLEACNNTPDCPPLVLGQTSGKSSSSSTTHNITLPSGSSEGDLVVLLYMIDLEEHPTISDPGWISLDTTVVGSSEGSYEAVYKKLTTSQSSITITSDDDCEITYIAFLFENASVSTIGGYELGDSTAPESAGLTVSSGAGPYYQLYSAAWVADAGFPPLTAYPTGYTTYQAYQQGSIASLAASMKMLCSSESNPGAWALASSAEWLTGTYLISPDCPEGEQEVEIGLETDCNVDISAFVLPVVDMSYDTDCSVDMLVEQPSLIQMNLETECSIDTTICALPQVDIDSATDCVIDVLIEQPSLVQISLLTECNVNVEATAIPVVSASMETECSVSINVSGTQEVELDLVTDCNAAINVAAIPEATIATDTDCGIDMLIEHPTLVSINLQTECNADVSAASVRTADMSFSTDTSMTAEIQRVQRLEMALATEVEEITVDAEPVVPEHLNVEGDCGCCECDPPIVTCSLNDGEIGYNIQNATTAYILVDSCESPPPQTIIVLDENGNASGTEPITEGCRHCVIATNECGTTECCVDCPPIGCWISYGKEWNSSILRVMYNVQTACSPCSGEHYIDSIIVNGEEQEIPDQQIVYQGSFDLDLAYDDIPDSFVLEASNICGATTECAVTVACCLRIKSKVIEVTGMQDTITRTCRVDWDHGSGPKYATTTQTISGLSAFNGAWTIPYDHGPFRGCQYADEIYTGAVGDIETVVYDEQFPSIGTHRYTKYTGELYFAFSTAPLPSMQDPSHPQVFLYMKITRIEILSYKNVIFSGCDVTDATSVTDWGVDSDYCVVVYEGNELANAQSSGLQPKQTYLGTFVSDDFDLLTNNNVWDFTSYIDCFSVPEFNAPSMIVQPQYGYLLIIKPPPNFSYDTYVCSGQTVTGNGANTNSEFYTGVAGGCRVYNLG